jgi:hypothetical protein
LLVQHMRSRAWRNADNFCFEVDSSELIDLRMQISLILSRVLQARSEEASMSLVFSVRARIGSIGSSAHGNFSLIVKHSLHFFTVLDFLGCVNYPRFAVRCNVYEPPIDSLPCPLSPLLLRIDILMINFMIRICKMYIIIRMRRNLRLIDVFGCCCKMFRLNVSLVRNFRLHCLVIIRLERSLYDCCFRGLIGFAMKFIWSI